MAGTPGGDLPAIHGFKKMKQTNLITSMTLLALIISTSSLAHEATSEAPPPDKPLCETAAHFNDFDFWVGEWNVYSNDETRTIQGTNSITKHHKNCLIMENWSSADGSTGSSMNYSDAVEDQWRQLWVAGGYSIGYTGGLDADGAMVLAGKINYYSSGENPAFRGRWSLNADGSVRQFFEQHVPEKDKWAIWFDGLYVKKP